MELTVVAGNGLSIAFSDDLMLSKITKRVVNKFENLTSGKSPTLEAIRTIASRIEGSADDLDDDFEKVVGALETQAGLIQSLEELIELAPSDRNELMSALRASADFSRRLYDIGAGIVLQDILDHSPGGIDHTKHLHSFFQALIDCFSGVITFANLNYDSLVMSTLKTLEAPMCDLARGYPKRPITITNQNDDGSIDDLGSYDTYPLRNALDFPTEARYRIRLVHLHGSVTFWGSRDSGEHIKIPIEAIRAHDLLSDVTSERRNFQPSVILANSIEKPRRTQEPPFSLGYSAMTEGLASSTHWLIVGYSFRDESVNSRLRNNFLQSREKPIVLVCTHGDDLKRVEIEEILGWGAEDPSSRDWLIIDRNGVEGLESRGPWKRFVP